MFEYKDWINRIKNRSDITGMLTHLTKPQIVLSNSDDDTITIESVKNLICILNMKQRFLEQ